MPKFKPLPYPFDVSRMHRQQRAFFASSLSLSFTSHTILTPQTLPPLLPLLAPYIDSILPFPDEIVSDMITYAISEGNVGENR